MQMQMQNDATTTRDLIMPSPLSSVLSGNGDNTPGTPSPLPVIEGTNVSSEGGGGGGGSAGDDEEDMVPVMHSSIYEELDQLGEPSPDDKWCYFRDVVAHSEQASMNEGTKKLEKYIADHYGENLAFLPPFCRAVSEQYKTLILDKGLRFARAAGGQAGDIVTLRPWTPRSIYNYITQNKSTRFILIDAMKQTNIYMKALTQHGLFVAPRSTVDPATGRTTRPDLIKIDAKASDKFSHSIRDLVMCVKIEFEVRERERLAAGMGGGGGGGGGGRRGTSAPSIGAIIDTSTTNAGHDKSGAAAQAGGGGGGNAAASAMQMAPIPPPLPMFSRKTT